MSLANVVFQLRKLPVLAGNITVASFEDIKNWTFGTLPIAFVVPLEDTAGDNTSDTATWQVITQRIGIVVVFPGAAGVVPGNDLRGAAVAEQFDQVKFSIFRAILNWNPWNLAENPDLKDLADPIIGHAIRGFRYEGCSQLNFDLARLTYMFSFAIDFTISDDDGWKLDGVPLQEIDFKLIDADSGDTLAETDIKGLQDVEIFLRGVQAGAAVGKLTV